MIAVSTGVPGVGATTVTRRAVEALDNWHHRNYGDVMLETARSEDLVQSRDDIRRLDPEEQKRIQREAARSLAEEGKDRNLIVDTHCTISTSKGYLCGLPEWVLEELRPSVIVLVEAEPEEIVERRSKDESRSRDVQAEEGVHEHQEINRMAALSYAALTGATVKIIKNPDGGLNYAVAKLVEVLE